MERKGCGLYLKSHIHTPKPQIQDMEPRRERLGARTLPCDCGEKRRIKSVWMCLEKKLERREKERESTQKTAQKLVFFCKMMGLEAFIMEL